MKKQDNQDLKNLTNLLNANKICINNSRTENLKETILPHKLSEKYLGINIDENLNWKQLIYDKAITLNKVKGILFK